MQKGEQRVQRFVHSKWKKTQALVGNQSVREHIPDTRFMTRENLESMLNQYGMVYVKPDKGSFGIGVIRVERTGEEFKYQAGTTIRTFPGYEALFLDLKRVTRNRSYLAQKGIHLLKYKGRRFDIRVMVQKSPLQHWESTAMVGRVAHPKKIVTNYHNGGTLKSVPDLMGTYMNLDELGRFVRQLKSLGIAVARQLEAKYPGIKEIGIDIAVDQNKKYWILEVNTCPDPYIFKILKDKSVFRRVIRYAKAYGRIKSTKK
jgi:glutathione synthase/RimK-type ligase-like ATP-grasp enzyme